MTPAMITAIGSAAVAVIGAVTALVKVLKHQADPHAHNTTGGKP